MQQREREGTFGLGDGDGDGTFLAQWVQINQQKYNKKIKNKIKNLQIGMMFLV